MLLHEAVSLVCPADTVTVAGGGGVWEVATRESSSTGVFATVTFVELPPLTGVVTVQGPTTVPAWKLHPTYGPSRAAAVNGSTGFPSTVSFAVLDNAAFP
ncbi:hypothetical protein BCF44_10758 [Kutzneria buriramensis]|uniref:Uncharacterized protein n=1 Tax=Kutzneria buriramensis TaxID=1045776 RepID=A0A3E0HI92_9PSEU|nr:hypothetical protein BCF44_10758 [Kutzneria buriramensis]